MTLPRYQLGGDWDAPGPAIVFLHGMGGSLHNFAAVFDVLGHDHPVLTIELPGHGHSAPVPNPTAKAITDRVGAVIDAVVGDREYVIFAHSLGFYFATEMASTPGSRAIAIVGVSGGLFTVADLVASGWRGVLRHPLLWLSLQFALIVATARPSDRLCDSLNRGRLLWSLWPFLKPRLTTQAPHVGDSFREQGGPGARLLLKLARQADFVKSVRACPVDFEFVFGEKDPLTTRVDQRLARELVGGERVDIAPGAGHWPQVELPERVAALVRDVIRRSTPHATSDDEMRLSPPGDDPRGSSRAGRTD